MNKDIYWVMVIALWGGFIIGSVLGYSVFYRKSGFIFSQVTERADSAHFYSSKLVTYESEHITFKHPDTWKPHPMNSSGGSLTELVILGIPGVFGDQVLGYSSAKYDELKPHDVIYEESIFIDGRSGMKWISKGKDYIAYDYYTLATEEQGVFGVHVRTAQEDKVIEQQLDELVSTVKLR